MTGQPPDCDLVLASIGDFGKDANLESFKKLLEFCLQPRGFLLLIGTCNEMLTFQRALLEKDIDLSSYLMDMPFSFGYTSLVAVQLTSRQAPQRLDGLCVCEGEKQRATAQMFREGSGWSTTSRMFGLSFVLLNYSRLSGFQA